jgi:hypothetical protein
VSALTDLKRVVEDFTAEQLSGYMPRIAKHEKLIRDPVIGFGVLQPHEVPIVDSPLIQRLRRIRQTALCYQVYPGANHTRFEHSMGVAHRAQQMADALNAHATGTVPPERVIELRLAGILHDVGHGPFSHLSESIFSQQYAPQLEAIGLEDARFYKKGLGEVLSSLIVTSGPFREFADKVFSSHGVRVDLDRISSWFVGTATAPEDQYLADIISGPFDADKLDYFERDCYYTGIRAEIDIQRILAVLGVREREGRHRLVVRRAGVHHLEQIIFNKLLLFSSVYHHHKIRALECATRAVFRRIWRDPHAIGNAALRFPNIGSLLSVTDEEFWTLAMMETELQPLVAPVARRRDPPMRVLALSLPTIDQDGWPANDGRRIKYQELAFHPEWQRTVGDTIQGMLDKADQDHPYGVWFDMPKSPPVSDEAKKTWVDQGDELVPLTAYFPGDEWVATYSDNKLTAHVFFDPPEDARRRVAVHARAFLRESYGLVCKPVAEEMCFKE